MVGAGRRGRTWQAGGEHLGLAVQYPICELRRADDATRALSWEEERSSRRVLPTLPPYRLCATRLNIALLITSSPADRGRPARLPSSQPFEKAGAGLHLRRSAPQARPRAVHVVARRLLFAHSICSRIPSGPKRRTPPLTCAVGRRANSRWLQGWLTYIKRRSAAGSE